MVILRDFLTKLRGLADDKLNIIVQIIFVLDREEMVITQLILYQTTKFLTGQI